MEEDIFREDTGAPLRHLLNKFGVIKAISLAPPSPSLKSQDRAFDDLLEGGLSFGSISEWGLPFARGGRELILSFLVSATQGLGLSAPLQCLWVASPKTGLRVYAPAWAARGIDLRHIRFAKSSQAVRDLKPVLTKPVFKVIVFDDPEKMSADDLAFIASEARAHHTLILLLRNYLLSPSRPNVWAKIRVNAWRDPAVDRSYQLEHVKGLAFTRATVGLPGYPRAV